MKHKLKQDHGALRARHYPPLAEQVGAMMKAIEALGAGKAIPPDAAAVIEAVTAVKNTFPKPKKEVK